jgi:hypothetical protein
MAWKRSQRYRTEACATVELAQLYFDLGRLDEAQLLIRSVHNKYAQTGWNLLYRHCLVLLAECELRLGLKTQCISTCLLLSTVCTEPEVRALYARRLLQLARLPGTRAVVRPLEPLFRVRAVRGLAGEGCSLLEIELALHDWSVPPVVLDHVVAELHTPEGDSTLTVSAGSEVCFDAPGQIRVLRAPLELKSGQLCYFYKLVVEIGALHLVHLQETSRHALFGAAVTAPTPPRAASQQLPAAAVRSVSRGERALCCVELISDSGPSAACAYRRRVAAFAGACGVRCSGHVEER